MVYIPVKPSGFFETEGGGDSGEARTGECRRCKAQNFLGGISQAKGRSRQSVYVCNAQSACQSGAAEFYSDGCFYLL